MSRERRIQNEKKRGLLPDNGSLEIVPGNPLPSGEPSGEGKKMNFQTRRDKKNISLVFGEDYPFKPPAIFIDKIPFKRYVYTNKLVGNIHNELLYNGWSPRITVPDILIYVLDKIEGDQP